MTTGVGPQNTQLASALCPSLQAPAAPFHPGVLEAKSQAQGGGRDALKKANRIHQTSSFPLGGGHCFYSALAGALSSRALAPDYLLSTL